MTISRLELRDLMLLFRAGTVGADRLYRALLDYPAWQLPVDGQSRPLCWTVEGLRCIAPMSEGDRVDGGTRQMMPMGGQHLMRHFPEGVDGAAFDYGMRQQVVLLGPDIDVIRHIGAARPFERLLDSTDLADVRLFQTHPFLVRTLDGAPILEPHQGFLSVHLFSSKPALDRHLAFETSLAAASIATMPGSEIFAHLNGRSDFDAVWIDPHRQGLSDPFGPALGFDICDGVDPRPEARIWPARSIAEIHAFLDQRDVPHMGRTHHLAYMGETLAATYSATNAEGSVRSFQFRPVGSQGSRRDLGTGTTQILCAGRILADLHVWRSRLGQTAPDSAAERAEGLARAAMTCFAQRTGQVMRRHLKTALGAKFVRDHPDIANVAWVEQTLAIALAARKAL
jgi:hypothetical protein